MVHLHCSSRSAGVEDRSRSHLDCLLGRLNTGGSQTSPQKRSLRRETGVREMYEGLNPRVSPGTEPEVSSPNASHMKERSPLIPSPAGLKPTSQVHGLVHDKSSRYSRKKREEKWKNKPTYNSLMSILSSLCPARMCLCCDPDGRFSLSVSRLQPLLCHSKRRVFFFSFFFSHSFLSRAGPRGAVTGATTPDAVT